MTEFEKLKALKDSGELHHVTYRNQGTLWEGLWFYRKSETGFQGYDVAGCVSKASPDYESAYILIQGIGLHVGAYGKG